MVITVALFDNNDKVCINVCVFVCRQVMKLTNYMESFPFPFYVVIRDVASLPMTLSDALRQWFELVTAAGR